MWILRVSSGSESPMRIPEMRLMIGAAMAVLLTGACQRQPVVAPPMANLAVEAETALRAGDHARADGLYQQIGEDASGAGRELALARRAFIYALPGTDLYDPAQARAFLELLVGEFPETPRRTEVEALLRVLPEIDDLRQAGQRRLEEAEELRMALDEVERERDSFGVFLQHASPLEPAFDLERAREDYMRFVTASPRSPLRPASERILFLLSERERLLAAGVEHDQALAEIATLRRELDALRQELDRLKELDLRRPLPD